MLDEVEFQRPDGPVREKNLEVIPTRGAEFSDDFEWITMDLNDGEQVIILGAFIDYRVFI